MHFNWLFSSSRKSGNKQILEKSDNPGAEISFKRRFTLNSNVSRHFVFFALFCWLTSSGAFYGGFTVGDYYNYLFTNPACDKDVHKLLGESLVTSRSSGSFILFCLYCFAQLSSLLAWLVPLPLKPFLL